MRTLRKRKRVGEYFLSEGVSVLCGCTEERVEAAETNNTLFFLSFFPDCPPLRSSCSHKGQRMRNGPVCRFVMTGKTDHLLKAAHAIAVCNSPIVFHYYANAFNRTQKRSQQIQLTGQ